MRGAIGGLCVLLLALAVDGQQPNIPGFPQPSSSGNADFLSQFVNPPGAQNAQGQSFRITGKNLADVDWASIDRRAEEGWWHLYPFGERFYDADIASRPWNDQQIDLDFFFPFSGFRFNYTFIFPEGFVSFGYPYYIQPPYTFPTPGWPEKTDPSLVAAFLSAQTFMSVGETRISHVWYRVVSKPPNLVGKQGPSARDRLDQQQQPLFDQQNQFQTGNRPAQRYYGNQLLKTQQGRVEDPELLDQITRDIRKGMVGARGFSADYALIVTWERMAYGGSPKVTQLNLYEDVKRWQNTYQMVITSDEVRSYTMFNYANINWTSSTSAGAISGRGGLQSALVGFNGGNGTGFVQLPYSAEGNSYKLVQFGSTQTAGRWLARTDESIQYGGCTNTSIGKLYMHDTTIPMLGGFAVNVSGPCFRGSNIKLQIDEITVDCEKIDMVKARCVIPVYRIYRLGLVNARLSIDGGNNYPWWTKAYILEPAEAGGAVRLLNDPLVPADNWKSPYAQNLTLKWSSQNITTDPNANVDVVLWGYWEDVTGHEFVEIGSIARNLPNQGAYSFNPRTLAKTDMLKDSWRRFFGGVVQVRVSKNWREDRGDGLYWSKPLTFPWYFRETWERRLGKDWALDLCKQWYEYDGRRMNFIMELEPTRSCPCTLNQAVVDVGRLMPIPDCDMFGNTNCYYHQGAQHCVQSVAAVWTGASQTCCYDNQGWLMFSNDYEYNPQYLRFYSAGVPYRAHPRGAFPYKRPPYVPTMSNLYNDLIPYDHCCKYAGHCEFYYWRRQTSGCQEYRSPVVGFAYGEPHFVTFDGQRYTFNGNGFYVLTMLKSPRHNLMVQIRLEQPPDTIWNSAVRATVITGVAARDNNSATVQVFARKNFRRWRYKTDLYVDGKRQFTDRPHKKNRIFNGVTVNVPPRVMDQSHINLRFDTGLGLVIRESRGMLSVEVVLPPEYNETYAVDEPRDWLSHNGAVLQHPYHDPNRAPETAEGKCANYYRTMGLLGTFNGDKADDFLSPECSVTQTFETQTENDQRRVFLDFAEKWRVDGTKHPLLFQSSHKPLYYPARFGDKNFVPSFNPWTQTNNTFWESLIFTREQVRVACQGVASCEYDYLMTGRKEVALETLHMEKSFLARKQKGEKKYQSCGNLMKNRGVIKYPVGNTYLDGVTLTFSCKPEYFMHGTQQRTCINGTWTPGWWAWCRPRALEQFLVWLVCIITAIFFCSVFVCIFAWCMYIGKKERNQKMRQPRAQSSARNNDFGRPPLRNDGPPISTIPPKAPANDVPVFSVEPRRGAIDGTAF